MLSTADGERLLAGLAELYVLGPVEALPARALRISRSLIGCDEASFNEIDLVAGTFKALVDPADNAYSSAAPAFAAYVHQHPVIAHIGRTGDSRPHAISDFLDRREFHRLGLYGEFFGLLGFEDQLSITMQVVPGHQVIGLALDRGSGYSPSERELLAALRPHLVRAYRNAIQYSEALTSHGTQHPFARDAATRLARLTDRQHDVLALIAAGHTNAQVARLLDIRVATVKKHVENVLERMQAPSRISAARFYFSAAPQPIAPAWWIIDGSSPKR